MLLVATGDGKRTEIKRKSYGIHMKHARKIIEKSLDAAGKHNNKKKTILFQLFFLVCEAKTQEERRRHSDARQTHVTSA